MSEDNHKSRLHVHLGRLIIIVAIIWVLLKVDLKTVVKSPQLQENISYMRDQAVSLWDKYLATPAKEAWDSLFKNMVNKGIDQAKNVVDNKLDNLKQ